VLADVILGTRCMEPARIGDVAVLMRALAELELEDVLADARALVSSQLPGPSEPAPARAAYERRVAPLVRAARDRRVVALASIDPSGLRDGVRAPMLTAGDVEGLPPAIVDELLAAQMIAQRRALPRLDDRAQATLHREIVAHATLRFTDRLRARNTSPSAFFDCSPRAVTGWQGIYFMELSR
jgi:hypothetical protein